MMELLHSFRRVSPDAQQGASRSASFTLAMGFLVFLAPALVGSAVVLLLAAWFGLDGLRCLAELRRQWSRGQARFRPALAAAGNLATAGLLGLLWNASATWVVALAGALRILGAGWNMVTAPVHTLHDTSATFSDSLGLSEHPDAVRLAERLVDEERQRRPIDRGWIAALLMILFAIHIGRMEAEWTLVGLLGPFVAVLGDMLVALLIAFGVIGPTRLGLRRLGRPLERRGWSRLAAADRAHRPWTDRLLFRWLSRNLRLSIRAHQTWYSIPFALERGLQAGLPIVAVLVATVPIWGMSWYFDTENWAAGIYNSWAEQRTDTWRQAMTRAVRAASPSGASTELFDVDPAGLTGDFAFVVIGDTGEGDASQQALVPQLLRVGGAADTRFVVISSDVVYPTGAMKNYEANFWLPFHGIERPVYAIPGNHDWYDALEGFAATFLEAGAARATMRARIETDHRLTSTTDSRIAWLIEQAGRYRDAYRVPTGFQRAPFFQVQTAGFALIAVDTGVLRRVDPDQDAWLRAALERARGKFIMVVLGHPLYAGGQYRAERDEGFEALHHLLRAHEVGLVMAGDTHDLEMYVERYATAGGERVMHHVVNGGGGAYLSFGTALAWPARPALADWAFYPSTSSVVDKLDRHTPLWKWPFWVWTRRFGAWPFSAEGLSAAFDYNVAPFFQSFVEVRVERSAGRVRLIPHGVNGRLRWADLQASPSLRPADRGPEDLVEVALPMPR
jgi:3',5'-cyclic AMP phosphodiesterase CpdA